LLNLEEKQYTTIEEIMSSGVVKLITNNSRVDNMDFPIEELVRIKQSSDIDMVKSVNNKMQQKAAKIKEDMLKENELFKQTQEYIKNLHEQKLQTIFNEKHSFAELLQDEYILQLSGNIQEEL
jgi:uncharacterized Ntn-hydrolase superfamily protein